jgi:hypothetical protein
MLAAGAFGLRLPLPARAELDLDPLNRWTEPKVALDVKPRSGPIKISVEYLIDEADVPEFLEVMAERQRIRRRDGARAWTLARDLEDPRIWVESYQTPTWVEYIRHNQRRTMADAGSVDRLRELHRGDGLPLVQRRIIRQATRFAEDPHPKAPIDHP